MYRQQSCMVDHPMLLSDIDEYGVLHGILTYVFKNKKKCILIIPITVTMYR